MKGLLYFILFQIVVLSRVNAATCTYAASTTGNWSTTANWSCGRLPQAGDLIFIPSTSTVNVTASVDLTASATYIYVKGTLNFSTSNKIDLASGSGVQIYSTGHLLGDEGDNSQKIKIGTSQVWTSKCNGGDVPPACGDVNGPVTYGTPLPVKLISFFIDEPVTNSVHLVWKTKEELNFNHFELERSSGNGEWRQIANIYPAIGGQYSFYDEKSSEKYYRLKTVDNNGTFEYSYVVHYDDDVESYIITNPGFLQVYSEESNGIIIIYNQLGQKIKEVNAVSGITEIPLNSGIYVVTLNGRSLGKTIVSAQ